MYVEVVGKVSTATEIPVRNSPVNGECLKERDWSLKPDIDVEQKTDIYAFVLNDILEFILRFAG